MEHDAKIIVDERDLLLNTSRHWELDELTHVKAEYVIKKLLTPMPGVVMKISLIEGGEYKIKDQIVHI